HRTDQCALLARSAHQVRVSGPCPSKQCRSLHALHMTNHLVAVVLPSAVTHGAVSTGTFDDGRYHRPDGSKNVVQEVRWQSDTRRSSAAGNVAAAGSQSRHGPGVWADAALTRLPRRRV